MGNEGFEFVYGRDFLFSTILKRYVPSTSTYPMGTDGRAARA
jgi:hypothetical protein